MRIGLLGTGPWAQSVHAPALGAHPGFDLAGVWGRRREAAAQLAGRCGVRHYEDPDALFADVDAVAIALPPAVQAELAARAAKAGCHLLLDKPLAVDVPAARRVVEAAEASGVASVVFFTLRFGAETGGWVTEQAAVGGWFTARADWLGAVFTSASVFAASPWRRERGGLWDVGPHVLSVLLPVLGPVEEVMAAPYGPGDTVHMVLRHASGASSTAVVSLSAPPKAAGVSIELRGESGVIGLPEGGDGPVQALGRAGDALLDSVRTGVAHPCGAAFGLVVVEVLAAAERSLREGHPVRVAG